jgi:hypothetical protein
MVVIVDEGEVVVCELGPPVEMGEVVVSVTEIVVDTVRLHPVRAITINNSKTSFFIWRPRFTLLVD